VRSGSRTAALAAGALLAAACAEPVAVETEARHPTFTDVFTFLARESPPGSYPKYLLGRQTYWTIVGAPDDEKEALVNEEGMIEVDDGSFSLEPFLFANGGLVTWADAELSQSLAEGSLPIPTVAWRTPGLVLEITAFTAGEAGASTLHASYRVENVGAEATRATLFLALRPFQVSPPWQSLNIAGGPSAVRELAREGRGVRVNGEKLVVSLTPPQAFGAARFEEGPVTDWLREGRVPPGARIQDPAGFASGALEYAFELAPGASASVHVAAPFHGPGTLPAEDASPDEVEAFVRSRLDATAGRWRALLSRVVLDLPPAAEPLARTARTALAHVLINRDGPKLQPGSRNYARSWIRDGSFETSALLGWGFEREPREFVRWFAGFQREDGYVPCCVDERGADTAPEHDSHGEFVFAVRQVHRFTRDDAFLREMWPRVVGAVEHLDALRRERLTDAYRAAGKRAYYGILPESISHEGYWENPVHSYWDDFFALRGFEDAAAMAKLVGDAPNAGRFAALRDAFAHDLAASIVATMELHGLETLPASVELGDFDPTATAAAIAPVGARALLPEAALAKTFGRWVAEVDARREGRALWENYAPYELRNVEALVHLGERASALRVLDFEFAGRRPAAWNQWAEIVWSDPANPMFVGDMPHGWVASTYLRALRSLFAYEREADEALVLAAGVPAAWLAGGEPIRVRGLPTWWGPLDYELRAEGRRTLRFEIRRGLELPPGGIVLEPPLDGALRSASVNGRAVPPGGGALTLREVPARVLLRY
jgi:hypothetical protein